jgi:hydroxymethylpyrimidine pyrophosphatase-like HAD family hydrolase
MENAVPELKDVADVVICSNEEHSAQYILEHYID